MTRRKKSKSGGWAQMAPNLLLAVVVSFVLASVVAGEWFDAYETFWWWDDMLHAISGVIIGFIGFLIVYFLNAQYRMTINPLFVALFALTFAVTIGVVWEIIEFSTDVLFHTAMQRWNLPEDAKLMGMDYQGVGLRDTMSDLIVSTFGALLTSTICYFAYKHRRPAVLNMMRHTAKKLRVHPKPHRR